MSNATEEMTERLLAYKTGEMVSLMAHLGIRLGVYEAMAARDVVSVDELAEATGLHRRWLLEWLRQQTAAGITQPIYAGIMPILNFANLARFSRNCGAEIPRWIALRIEDYGDDQESIRKFGVEVVSQLCQTLIDSGAPGIHFYTMNQVEPTREIYNNLGL